MQTVEALSLMDNESVAAIWLETSNFSLDGETFNQFYCTFNGKLIKSNFKHRGNIDTLVGVDFITRDQNFIYGDRKLIIRFKFRRLIPTNCY